MTPAQLYARERRELADAIRQNTPRDELHPELIRRIRPAIAFDSQCADDAQIPLGASKFIGAPDVPDSFEWPTYQGQPQHFVAQINLDEIAPFDVEGVLPTGGVLAFFADFQAWNDDTTATAVFHFPRVANRLALPYDAWDWNVVTLSPRVTACPLNSTGAEFYPEVGEPPFRGAPGIADWPFDGGDVPAYQLLGYPASVQNDPRYSSADDGAGWQDWRLLFSMDGDPNAGSEWGDSGMLYWTIRGADLARGDFSNCRFHFDEC